MKSLTHIHFGNKIPREGAPIAYIQTPELFASDVVSVSDLSNILPQNAFYEKDVEIELDGDDLTYFLDKSGFLLTDQLNKNGFPLYFKHKLRYPVYDPSGEGAADIIVLDKNDIQVDTRSWKYDCSNQVIYHSLSAMEQGIENPFYVIYPRADEFGNLINNKHKELLDSAPAFSPALEKDILDSGCVNPDSDVYVLEELNGQPYYWRITLPRSGKYFLRYTDDGILKAKMARVGQSEPWFIEIQNTVMLATQLTSNDFLRYEIAEFELQSFYPFPPIRLIADRKAELITKDVLWVSAKDLVLSVKTPIDIKIYNAEGRIIRAVTTDQNKLGESLYGIAWEVDLIESIDLSTGRIALTRELKGGEYALVSFYHKENVYRYTGVNLNPLFNPDILNQRVGILIRPDAIGCRKTVSHVLLEQNDKIISASDESISKWLETGTKYLSDLESDWLYIPGKSTGNINNYFMIALISVSSYLQIQEALVKDARRRGGGIIDDLIQEALHFMPDARSNFDIGFWDGPPAPLQGAAMVYLPKWVSSVYSEEEIRARANQYAPAGARLVIRYY